jgi:histidinol dehydrogenase
MSETFAFEGMLEELGSEQLRQLVDRRGETSATTRSTVEAIIGAVVSGGDAALREMASQYDGVDLERLDVPRDE